MHIRIITPAKVKSLSGNRATAQRWAAFLRELGHRVSISVDWDKSPADMMVALHAWRSADAIADFKQMYPQRPLIVAMTGTDLYRFILSHPEPTLASIKSADRLVVLHDLAYKVLPVEARKKVHIIYQSALPLAKPRNPGKRFFDICVVGHLRDEKDSLRAAYAVRDLPQESRIRVLHYGKAHNEEWAQYARDEMAINSRYQWFDEIPHWKIRLAYGRCQLMVLSSNMEGGANVISEACVAGLPVIASRIDGSVGLLGKDYSGYYPVQDTDALRQLLLKAENEKTFVNHLQSSCANIAHKFTVESEKNGWADLLTAMELS